VAGFVEGLMDTRERIRDALGGSRREALPTRAGKVVCTCLTRAVVDEPGVLLALVAEGAPSDASLVLLLEEAPDEAEVVRDAPSGTPPAAVRA
jgi:hypothetical protein